MFSTALANWTLLLGVGLLMLGHGLQGTLLGVRAHIEGFPTAVIGIVMAGYSIGYLLGAARMPRLIARVGHVRVFAAVASVASTTILLHGMFPNYYAWFALRCLNGFCLAGVYIVAESWLNGAARNTERGSLLSIYSVVMLLGIMLGQALLTIDDPGNIGLFIVVSILLSLATVPMLLSRAPAPIVDFPRGVGLRELYRISPLGFVGMFMIGVAQASLFNMGAVFASGLGMSIAAVATFMTMVYLGGTLLQWPIGKISDRFDRRSILILVNLLAAGSMLLAFLGAGADTLVLTVLFFVYGGLCMPLYALCLAHTNDYLDTDQMVGASSTLALIMGLGMIAGPMLSSFLMQAIGSRGFPLFLLVTHASFTAFALYRMTQRPAQPLDAQGRYVTVTSLSAASPMATTMAQERAQSYSGEGDTQALSTAKERVA